MIIRAVDSENDWLFGKGLNDYRSGQAAIQQNIKNNLLMFLGDCFAALDQGIDWWNLLGGKNETAINLAVNAAILGTEGVTGIRQTSINLNNTRQLSIVYNVTTVFSVVTGSFTYDLGTAG
jgi:hypothetical protein